MAPTRTPRQTTTGTRRAGAPRARAAAPTPRRATGFPGRRSKPQPQSNARKVAGAVASALPALLEKAGTPAKKAKPGSRKGGAGLAILGAGAGLAALKNRDKLPAKLGGKRSDASPAAGEPTTNVGAAQPIGTAVPTETNGTQEPRA